MNQCSLRAPKQISYISGNAYNVSDLNIAILRLKFTNHLHCCRFASLYNHIFHAEHIKEILNIIKCFTLIFSTSTFLAPEKQIAELHIHYV